MSPKQWYLERTATADVMLAMNRVCITEGREFTPDERLEYSRLLVIETRQMAQRACIPGMDAFFTPTARALDSERLAVVRVMRSLNSRAIDEERAFTEREQADYDRMVQEEIDLRTRRNEALRLFR